LVKNNLPITEKKVIQNAHRPFLIQFHPFFTDDPIQKTKNVVSKTTLIHFFRIDFQWTKKFYRFYLLFCLNQLYLCRAKTELRLSPIETNS